MRTTPKKRLAFSAVIMCFLLSACGLHLRQARDFPSVLRKMTVSSNNVNQGISDGLEKRLRANGVQINSGSSPVRLTLANSRFSTLFPPILSGKNPHSVTYRLSVQMALEQNKKVIFNSTVRFDKTLIYNTNQINPPAIPSLIRRRLTEGLVDQLFSILSRARLK